VKTPVSVKVKKEVAAVANDVATPVVEAVTKRVRPFLTLHKNFVPCVAARQLAASPTLCACSSVKLMFHPLAPTGFCLAPQTIFVKGSTAPVSTRYHQTDSANSCVGHGFLIASSLRACFCPCSMLDL
jgi:hypothetical protein